MRFYRSTGLEDVVESPAEPELNVTTDPDPSYAEQLSDREAIQKILTHYVYYILLGTFILIFIGIYFVCR